jgi:class 3 adenylate cyclase
MGESAVRNEINKTKEINCTFMGEYFLNFLASIPVLIMAFSRRLKSFAVIPGKHKSPRSQLREDRLLVPFGVVGVVDIVSSTEISNSMDIFTEWEIKNRFFERAEHHAKHAGLTIVNHTGDGFLFLVDQSHSPDWANALVWFYESLVQDFRSILQDVEPGLPHVDSGLRFGVAAGTLLVGQSSTTKLDQIVVGAEVNLAARLCESAKVNEMVISTRVWDVLKYATNCSKVQKRVHKSLKGFDHSIPAMHWQPRKLKQ